MESDRREAYEKRAKQLWGDTQAYRQYEKKKKGRPDAEARRLESEMIGIFGEFGKIRGTDPSSEEALRLVKRLRDFITANYYDCTDEILSGLGEAYGCGGEFTENIDRSAGDGTGKFASLAIRAYCERKRNETV